MVIILYITTNIFDHFPLFRPSLLYSRKIKFLKKNRIFFLFLFFFYTFVPKIHEHLCTGGMQFLYYFIKSSDKRKVKKLLAELKKVMRSKAKFGAKIPFPVRYFCSFLLFPQT